MAYLLCARSIFICCKLGIGRKIDSSVFIADAANMKLDIVISLSVLGGSIFVGITGLQIVDSIVGLAVSALVIKTSAESFGEPITNSWTGSNLETTFTG